ncbi:iron-sulfur cluster insertion protein ErpA, partial [Neisseria gonorrhoeae]
MVRQDGLSLGLEIAGGQTYLLGQFLFQRRS